MFLVLKDPGLKLFCGFNPAFFNFNLGTHDSNSMLWTGNQVKMESNYLSDAQHENRSMVDGVVSFKSDISQVDESNVVLPNVLEKSCWAHPDCDVDVNDFAKSDYK